MVKGRRSHAPDGTAPTKYRVRPTRQIKTKDELFGPYGKADAENVVVGSTGSRSYPLPNKNQRISLKKKISI